MKKIITLFTLVFVFNLNAQTSTINISEGSRMSSPIGTYIKDINNVFTPYIGIWKYQNGNEILTIKLEKVTKYYDPKFKVYFDFIKGNYSYTIDGGNTYIINTLTNNPNNTPEGNPIYTSDPTFSENIFGFNFIMKDLIKNKSCRASLQFYQNNSNQIYFKLQPSKHFESFDEEQILNNESIPINIILTKQ